MVSIIRSSSIYKSTGTSALPFSSTVFTRSIIRTSIPQTSKLYTSVRQITIKSNQRASTPRYFSTTPPSRTPTTIPPQPPSTNQSTNPTMTSSHQTTTLKSADLFSLLANRRSYYPLTPNIPIPTSTLKTILTSTLQTVPSSFNSQTTRVILLLGSSHHKLWDITGSLLRAHMGEERWSSAPTANKIAGFRGAAGTVLFYEDQRDVNANKEKFKAYAEHFDAWSEQTSGMHQLAVWAALEAEGLGANLQHYNPMIDEDVKKEFGVEEGWKLRAQMVFGGVEGGRPDAKEKKSTDVTMKVFE